MDSSSTSTGSWPPPNCGARCSGSASTRPRTSMGPAPGGERGGDGRLASRL